jgi:hypothetical protein
MALVWIDGAPVSGRDLFCRGTLKGAQMSGMTMLARTLFISVSLGIAAAPALAFDDSAYPAWKGQWTRIGGGQWGQRPPLTPEYQAIFEAGQKDQAAGGHGNNATPTCIPPGMPRAMLPYESMEFVITPDVTYVIIEFMNQLRRIYTDGRAWPDPIQPSFLGYSIGHWDDEPGGKARATLVVETRGMRGPRTFDGSTPLHSDNQTVVKERITLDRTDPTILHNEITTIDHALASPWTVKRSYHREAEAVWFEYPCAENNEHVFIGKDNYLLSADGKLMPTRKNQPPPDLRYFDLRPE